jgi:uncharacterized membrane protein
MKKSEFLKELRLRLSDLPSSDIKHSVDYYSEMIDDRIEDGLSEEEAVRKIGTPAKAAEEILTTLPITTLMRARIKRGSGHSVFLIILVILGSPIWISLLAVGAAIIISLLAALFSVFVVFWAAEIAIAASAAGTLIGAPILLIGHGNFAGALFSLGAALLLGGLAILFFFPVVWITKGIFLLFKLTFRFIKFCLIRKEAIR